MPSFTLKNEALNIKLFLLIYFGLSLSLSTLTYCAITPEYWNDFMGAQILTAFSVLVISLSVWLFFLKKNIALLIGVIVFKWPILIYLFYRLTDWQNLKPIAFSMGILPVIMSALIWSLLQKE